MTTPQPNKVIAGAKKGKSRKTHIPARPLHQPVPLRVANTIPWLLDLELRRGHAIPAQASRAPARADVERVVAALSWGTMPGASAADDLEVDIDIDKNTAGGSIVLPVGRAAKETWWVAGGDGAQESARQLARMVAERKVPASAFVSPTRPTRLACVYWSACGNAEGKNEVLHLPDTPIADLVICSRPAPASAPPIWIARPICEYRTTMLVRPSALCPRIQFYDVAGGAGPVSTIGHVSVDVHTAADVAELAQDPAIQQAARLSVAEQSAVHLAARTGMEWYLRLLRRGHTRTIHRHRNSTYVRKVRGQVATTGAAAATVVPEAVDRSCAEIVLTGRDDITHSWIASLATRNLGLRRDLLLGLMRLEVTWTAEHRLQDAVYLNAWRTVLRTWWAPPHPQPQPSPSDSKSAASPGSSAATATGPSGTRTLRLYCAQREMEGVVALVLATAARCAADGGRNPVEVTFVAATDSIARTLCVGCRWIAAACSLPPKAQLVERDERFLQEMTRVLSTVDANGVVSHASALRFALEWVASWIPPRMAEMNAIRFLCRCGAPQQYLVSIYALMRQSTLASAFAVRDSHDALNGTYQLTLSHLHSKATCITARVVVG